MKAKLFYLPSNTTTAYKHKHREWVCVCCVGFFLSLSVQFHGVIKFYSCETCGRVCASYRAKRNKFQKSIFISPISGVAAAWQLWRCVFGGSLVAAAAVKHTRHTAHTTHKIIVTRYVVSVCSVLLAFIYISLQPLAQPSLEHLIDRMASNWCKSGTYVFRKIQIQPQKSGQQRNVGYYNNLCQMWLDYSGCAAESGRETANSVR